MSAEIELLELALLAYEAAADPALWPIFLQRYAQALDAEFAFLHLHHFAGGRSQMLATSTGYDPLLQQSYHEHYSRVNLWRERGRKLFRSGVVLLEEEICPRPVTTHSEFYNDYLLRMGATRSMGVAIKRVEQYALMAPPMRAEYKAPFGEEQRQFARRLLPHLARANLLRERLEFLKAGEEVLDRLTYGVVFLTAEGQVLYANRAAEAIFREEDGFFARAGVLSTQSPHGDSALRHAIRQAAQPETSAEWPKPVLVARRSLRRSYQVLVAPLRRRFAQFSGVGAPSVVALITDPEQQSVALPEAVEHLYGLTKREAAVATQVAEGKAVEQLADELGMRYETARTHLRRIFDKTGVSRQAELVSLLARIPRQIRGA